MIPRTAVSQTLHSFLKPLRNGVIAGLCALAVAMALPNRYTSVARILPVESKGIGGNIGLAAAAAAVGLSLPGQDSSDAAYPDILNSYWLRTALLDTEFTFSDRSWHFAAPVSHTVTLRKYFKARTTEAAFRGLDKILRVNRDLKTKLISIEAETKSQELSQQVVRRCSDLLNSFAVEKSMTRGAAKARFAGERLADARKEKTRAENNFFAFLNGNRNYTTSIDPQVRLSGLRLEEEWKLRTQIVATLAVTYEQALLEEKSSPRRGALTLTVTFLVMLGSWLWSLRGWIQQALRTE